MAMILTYTYTHTYTHTHTHTHTHTYTDTQTHSDTDRQTHKHKHKHTHTNTLTHTHTHTQSWHHGYIGVFPTNQPYWNHFLYKSTMTELVSSGYLKSNIPRADRRQATVVSCWDGVERESRENMGGGGLTNCYFMGCSSLV